jgi:predicted anti-sigma-YlaC factor YlaD
MTPRLICPDIERLVLEAEDRELTSAERDLVEGHIRGCDRCRAFAADRAVLRREIASVSWPGLPGELDRRTRRKLQPGGAAERPAAVPAWVLVALAVITIITGTWLAVSLADVGPEATLADLSVAGLAAVIIIAQNALMLFFAPVVLRTFRARQEGARRAA